MRITQEQASAIKDAAHAVLGEHARVVLFGSRVNDQLKGGDIDLLVETPKVLPNRTEATGRIYAKLIKALGDRKIDLILKDAQTVDAPIHQIARQTGVVL